ncbi:hypothetical protein MIND_00409700 [Mycena indigotica]|uniref:Uncharacterized protein n=1 Tax=Mycena indigotica TaxID=2126181 RepID=A0A8H6W567_9AGAR|nr:uncharacterized protein MIND_00409700 [Mycena indigotica]KAF7306194.1 hypothetical protein MIND_00409700 [Mycena indigotica]
MDITGSSAPRRRARERWVCSVGRPRRDEVPCFLQHGLFSSLVRRQLPLGIPPEASAATAELGGRLRLLALGMAEYSAGWCGVVEKACGP